MKERDLIGFQNADGEWCCRPSPSFERRLMKCVNCSNRPLTTVIRRYSPFKRFLQILESKSIWFARADQLGDPFEMSYPKAFTVDDLQIGDDEDIPDDKRAKIAESFAALRKDYRKFHYASCWNGDITESELLWFRYGDNDPAKNPCVAIESTIEHLTKLKPQKLVIDDRDFIPQLWIADALYIDFDRDDIPKRNHPFFYKRMEYKADQEVRAIVSLWSMGWRHQGDTPLGFKVSIKPNSLIQKVILSPKSTDAFAEQVHQLATKYKLKAPIVRSKLDDEPKF